MLPESSRILSWLLLECFWADTPTNTNTPKVMRVCQYPDRCHCYTLAVSDGPVSHTWPLQWLVPSNTQDSNKGQTSFRHPQSPERASTRPGLKVNRKVRVSCLYLKLNQEAPPGTGRGQKTCQLGKCPPRRWHWSVESVLKKTVKLLFHSPLCFFSLLKWLALISWMLKKHLIFFYKGKGAHKFNEKKRKKIQAAILGI